MDVGWIIYIYIDIGSAVMGMKNCLNIADDAKNDYYYYEERIDEWEGALDTSNYGWDVVPSLNKLAMMVRDLFIKEFT